MGLNSEYSRSVFGRETRFNPRPLTTAVAVTATHLWRASPDRVALVIQNIGAQNMYVGTSPTVSATNGLLLGAGGGVMSLSAEQDGETPTREWWGLAAAVGTTIYSAEVVGV